MKKIPLLTKSQKSLAKKLVRDVGISIFSHVVAKRIGKERGVVKNEKTRASP